MTNQSFWKRDQEGQDSSQVASSAMLSPASFRIMKGTQVMGLWNLPLQFERTAESRVMARDSLDGGPRRSLCVAMKVKLELNIECQRLQSQEKSAKQGCKQGVAPAQEREVCCNPQSRMTKPSKPFDIRQGGTGLGVCPAGFLWSSLALVHYFLAML